jgi:hypothetical protein
MRLPRRPAQAWDPHATCWNRRADAVASAPRSTQGARPSRPPAPLMNHGITHMKRTIAPARAGCWIDEVNGWHAHYQVAELALSLGWLTTKDPAAPLPGYATTRRHKSAEVRARRAEVRAVLAAYKRGDDTARYRQHEIDDVPAR